MAGRPKHTLTLRGKGAIISRCISQGKERRGERKGEKKWVKMEIAIQRRLKYPNKEAVCLKAKCTFQ